VLDLSYAFAAWCLHTECILEQDTITELLLSAFFFLPSSLFVHWLYITPVAEHLLKFQ